MKLRGRHARSASKKVENHEHALALHYVHYNFARVQKAIGGTPAMAAGLTTRPWSIEEIPLHVRFAREIVVSRVLDKPSSVLRAPDQPRRQSQRRAPRTNFIYDIGHQRRPWR